MTRPSFGLRLLIHPAREEAALWRRFRETRTSRLREGLFGRYHAFARLLARRQARRSGVAPDVRQDLEQLAYSGLLEAIERFDPTRDRPFRAFAASRITGSMLDGLAQLDESRAQLRFRRRVERERLASLGSTATTQGRSATEELADLVGELALGLMLDAQRRGQSGFGGRSDSGFDSLAWRQTKALLAERVEALGDPEKTVVRQHYQYDLLFSQIAAMLGLSRGRISQIHKSALAKLHRSMRSLR